MDSNTLSLYVHELRNQCMYAEAALGLFNQSMEKKSPTGLFFAAQSFMTGVSNVSRLLWPGRTKAKRRGDELRRILGIPQQHVLSDTRLHNFWEYGDERTDDWIKNSRGQLIAFDFLGPKDKVGNRTPKDEHIYRLYDPETREYIYRGEVYNLQQIASLLAEISARINEVHDQLFPKEKQAEASANDKTAEGAPKPAVDAAPSEAPDDTAVDTAKAKTEA